MSSKRSEAIGLLDFLANLLVKTQDLRVRLVFPTKKKRKE